ncbi:MAG: sigma 54-interacting transcriptional regulator [Alkalispirochaetaceae bacterium]
MLKTVIITADRGVFNSCRILFDRCLACYHQPAPVLALDDIRSQQPHLILIDVECLTVEPRRFIPEVILAGRRAPVVVILRSMLLELVVEMVLSGATDCLVLPPKDPPEAARRLARLAGERQLRKERITRRKHEAFSTMVGESEAMMSLQERILRLSRSDAAVSIEGETGSGKELVAQAIHHLSKRRTHGFVTRNCASLPEQLVESELFGVGRGAYTGAVERPGSFEEAHRGTLFLDEIADLAPAAQSKLLRVTEDGQVRRVGESGKREVDVRLLVASNRPLRRLCNEGGFRRDLFFRLSALTVVVPPLRARMEDIRVIASTYLDRMSRGERVFSEGALRLLEGHHWPGNVRELLNVVERSRVLCDERVIPPEAISIDDWFEPFVPESLIDPPGNGGFRGEQPAMPPEAPGAHGPQGAQGAHGAPTGSRRGGSGQTRGPLQRDLPL